MFLLRLLLLLISFSLLAKLQEVDAEGAEVEDYLDDLRRIYCGNCIKNCPERLSPGDQARAVQKSGQKQNDQTWRQASIAAYAVPDIFDRLKTARSHRLRYFRTTSIPPEDCPGLCTRFLRQYAAQKMEVDLTRRRGTKEISKETLRRYHSMLVFGDIQLRCDDMNGPGVHLALTNELEEPPPENRNADKKKDKARGAGTTADGKGKTEEVAGNRKIKVEEVTC